MNTDTTSGDPTMGFVMLFLLACAYFFPAIVAWRRGHHNTLAIFMTDLFFGWTFLGWVAALIWACTSNRRVIL